MYGTATALRLSPWEDKEAVDCPFPRDRERAAYPFQRDSTARFRCFAYPFSRGVSRDAICSASFTQHRDELGWTQSMTKNYSRACTVGRRTAPAAPSGVAKMVTDEATTEPDPLAIFKAALSKPLTYDHRVRSN